VERVNLIIAVIAVVVILIALFLVLSSISNTQPHPILDQNSSIAALDSFFPVISIALEHGNNTQIYEAYIATNVSQQARGYMNVTSTGDCHGISPCIGMLFYFQGGSDQCFWMQNTIIPLKQIWINATGVVTFIYNATPLITTSVCHVGPMVLETNPNQTIAIGDRIILRGTP
jgi:uncharacterized membrane protein (UPF0127 family)